MTRPFDKPALTYQQQIELLENRGMIISDHAEARFYLQHLNYYRLRGYWLPFEIREATLSSANVNLHQFQPGTTFETVLDNYRFDRELRLLVLDAIERIEVSVRSAWAYQLAQQHGTHAHLNPKLFRKTSLYAADKKKLLDEIGRSDEVFIKHLIKTYDDELPPVWAVCEVMSLGLLSRWYQNLGPINVRSKIAHSYGVDHNVLGSWLQHLTIVRNICAHHSRLWNRELAVTPRLPKNKTHKLANEFIVSSRRLYNTLVIMVHMLDVISPKHSWRVRLKNLLERHKIPTASMGFPDDWDQRPIWQEATP